MSRVALDIEGMSCAACSTRVSRVLSRVDGVERAEVNLALERATVDAAPAVTLDMLVRAVEKAGYTARLHRRGGATRAEEEAAAAKRRAEERQTLLRFLVSGLLSLILVLSTLPLMLGTGHALVGPWTQAALAAGVLAICSPRFWREAWSAVRAGTANMAVLVTLGTSVAFLYSLGLTVAGLGHGHLYFEAAAVVLTLVMLGKHLEARAKRSAASALRELAELAPPTAERVAAGGIERVPVEQLQRGDIIMVRPGTKVPADGAVVEGRSSLDEALLTGESLPVERGVGDVVIAGSVNGAGVLKVSVAAAGEETRLAAMVRLVEEAQMGEAPVQRMVDRVAAIFVPVVLVLALLSLGAWWLVLGDLERGVTAALSILVIACPCALGLATPTALVAGAGAAARAGILIRDIETLEKAHSVDTVAFDKTGTLTRGEPKVTEVGALDGASDTLIRLAAGLEAGSEHPLARALVQHAADRSVALPRATDITAHAGLGLSGTVEGQRVEVGNRAFMDERGVAFPDLPEGPESGGTLAFVAVDGRAAGTIGFADEPRAEAQGVVAALRGNGYQVVMLSGDNEQAAANVARSLGLDAFRASLLPAEKVAALRRMAADGATVAFVGDGVNDAGALAAAPVGIAMGSGTDVARAAAAITLMRADLSLVPAAIDICRATRNAIRANLVWAFLFNVIGIPLAAWGHLSPVLAGGAMAFSSVLVVGNSALLGRWRPAAVTA